MVILTLVTNREEFVPKGRTANIYIGCLIFTIFSIPTWTALVVINIRITGMSQSTLLKLALTIVNPTYHANEYRGLTAWVVSGLSCEQIELST